MFVFPVQLTTSRIGSLNWLIHTLLYVMTIHTYILRGIMFQYYCRANTQCTLKHTALLFVDTTGTSAVNKRTDVVSDMYGHLDQPGKVANLARGLLNRETHEQDSIKVYC